MAHEQRRRNVDAERLGGLAIDYQLEFRERQWDLRRRPALILFGSWSRAIEMESTAELRSLAAAA
jgi:hypothetical protein